MKLILEDYRLMRYFHTAKHIRKFHNLEHIKRDLAVGDPATLMAIAKFEQAEERLTYAADCLTERLDEVIREREDRGESDDVE